MQCPDCRHLFLEHDNWGCRHSACGCHVKARQLQGEPETLDDSSPIKQSESLGESIEWHDAAFAFALGMLALGWGFSYVWVTAIMFVAGTLVIVGGKNWRTLNEKRLRGIHMGIRKVLLLCK
jgi:hypothetical protein